MRRYTAASAKLAKTGDAGNGVNPEDGPSLAVTVAQSDNNTIASWVAARRWIPIAGTVALDPDDLLLRLGHRAVAKPPYPAEWDLVGKLRALRRAFPAKWCANETCAKIPRMTGKGHVLAPAWHVLRAIRGGLADEILVNSP
jgi:hypothetical protein